MTEKRTPRRRKFHLLTASRLKDARACSELERLRYREGYRPVRQASALYFGDLLHQALEAWGLEAKMGLTSTHEGSDRLKCALGRLASVEIPDPFDRVRLEELMRGYHARWIDEPLRYVAVEIPFETSLVHPDTRGTSKNWRLAGKMDGLVETMDEHPRSLILEHKSSSEDISPGSEYWRRLRMDGQISAYYEGADALGFRATGCLYDVIGKPTMKPYAATPAEKRKYTAEKSKKCGVCSETPVNAEWGPCLACKGTGRIVTESPRLYAGQRDTDETPEEFRARLRVDIAENPDRYFARAEVVRLEAERENFLRDVWQLGQRIREDELTGRSPKNSDACVRFGRLCSFFEVCSGAASLDDASLFRRVEDVHPELDNATRSKEETANVNDNDDQQSIPL